MKTELTMDDLLYLYCSLSRAISDMKEAKIRDHQRYGERYDERPEITIQAYTALAEKVYDMLEEDDNDGDKPDKR